MKKIVLIISLIIATGYALPLMAQTNAPYLKIVASSNNVPQLIQTLPEVEKLWPQEPNVYLRSLNQAAYILREASNNPAAKQAFVAVFTNMMSKACPTNEFEAAAWVNLKRDMVIFCYGHGGINDKSQWLAIAQFIGEIRSKMIPNYPKYPTIFSGIVASYEEQVAYQKALEKKYPDLTTERFQSELWQADTELLFYLQHNCPFVQSGQPVDTNFINQISTAAHLTDAEKQSLIPKQ